MTDGLNKLSMAWSSKTDVFERAFSHHYNELFLLAVRKVQSDDLAKDLVQEVFIALWNNLHDLETEKEILPYLYGVMRNKVLMQYRKSEVHLRYAVNAAKQVTAEHTSETILLNKELNSIITEEVSKMPKRMQEVYLLKKENGKSVKQIAEELGVSEQTVKNQLQNAYNRLRIRLKDYNSPLIMVGFVISHVPVLLHH